MSAQKDQVIAGPLLEGLLSIHRINEDALSRPLLESLANALVLKACQLGWPLVWPVGDAANRLSGAAALVAGDRFQLRGWADSLNGQSILLVSLASASPLELVAAAGDARDLGASSVHACVWEVSGFDAAELKDVFDTRSSLTLTSRVA